MTAEEYRQMEHEALERLQRIRNIGFRGSNIVFVMSRDVCLAAAAEYNTICKVVDYTVDGVQLGMRQVYMGYDIFLINEDSASVFLPAIKGFYAEGARYEDLSPDDLVISKMAAGDPHIYIMVQREPTAFLTFYDTGLTARHLCDVDIVNGVETWDEKLVSEDTKELDEFLNSFKRKRTLKS